jgi:hypothetical protein
MGAFSIIPFAGGTASIADAFYKNSFGTPLTDLEASNLVAQTAAMAGGYAANLGPVGASAAFLTGGTALTTGTLLLNTHIANAKANPSISADLTVVGDLITIAGDAVLELSSAAKVYTPLEPFALIGEGIGNDLAIAGLALTDPELEGKILSAGWNALTTEVKAEMSVLQPLFATEVNTANISAAWGVTVDNLLSLFNETSNSIANIGSSAFSNTADAASSDVGQLQSPLTTLFADSGLTPQNITETEASSGSTVTVTDGNGYVLGSSGETAFNADGSIELTSNLDNGTSNVTDVMLSGTSTATTYSGQNGTGTILALDVENANGTSIITTYNSNGSSFTTNYSGLNGTGYIKQTDANNSDGTSTQTNYNSSGQLTTIYNYAGANETGALQTEYQVNNDGSKYLYVFNSSLNITYQQVVNVIYEGKTQLNSSLDAGGLSGNLATIMVDAPGSDSLTLSDFSYGFSSSLTIYASYNGPTISYIGDRADGVSAVVLKWTDINYTLTLNFPDKIQYGVGTSQNMYITDVYFSPFSNSVACFCCGTMIRTPDGEKPVETLKRGDLVITAEGVVRPVLWRGEQTVSRAFADPVRSWPVRVKAGALGDNVPSRDLLLSPDHALLVGGVLIQAGALVNGASILRETQVPKRFTYYHLELDDHELILAENTPAETFVDNVDRMGFDNWAEYEALYPEGKAVAEMPYPRAKAHRQVPMHVRGVLADRVRGIGLAAA